MIKDAKVRGETERSRIAASVLLQVVYLFVFCLKSLLLNRTHKHIQANRRSWAIRQSVIFFVHSIYWRTHSFWQSGGLVYRASHIWLDWMIFFVGDYYFLCENICSIEPGIISFVQKPSAMQNTDGCFTNFLLNSGVSLNMQRPNKTAYTFVKQGSNWILKIRVLNRTNVIQWSFAAWKRPF